MSRRLALLASMDINKRQQAIFCGLFLSQYNRLGLERLGFNSFKEAFNVLGFSIGIKPASIKNYRDEFDPLFPNNRTGWDKRPMRQNCVQAYEEYKGHSIEKMLSMIVQFTGCTPSVETVVDKKTNTFAKRLLTGRAAENFFMENYRSEIVFQNTEAEDVTHTGCGYDFSLHRANGKQDFAVEVKGLSALSGNIVLTEKEHEVGADLADSYFIYAVKNFNETPFAVTIRNPINSELVFKRHERKIIQLSWSASI